MNTLQLPIDKGSQALSNFLYYNWACHALESFLINLNLTTFNNKKIISLFYGKPYSVNHVKVNRTRELWDKDLEVELDAKLWSDAFESAKKIFPCNRLRESQ